MPCCNGRPRATSQRDGIPRSVVSGWLLLPKPRQGKISREVGAHPGDERRRHAAVERRASRLERLGARAPPESVAATAAGVLFTIRYMRLDRSNRLVYYFFMKGDAYGRAGHSRHGIA